MYVCTYVNDACVFSMEHESRQNRELWGKGNNFHSTIKFMAELETAITFLDTKVYKGVKFKIEIPTFWAISLSPYSFRSPLISWIFSRFLCTVATWYSRCPRVHLLTRMRIGQVIVIDGALSAACGQQTRWPAFRVQLSPWYSQCFPLSLTVGSAILFF